MDWKKGISLKISALSTVLVLVTATVIGLKVTGDGQQAVILKEAENLQAQLEFRSERLASAITNLRQDVQFFASLPVLLELVRLPRNTDDTSVNTKEQQQLRDQLAMLFAARLQTRNDYFQMRYIARDGMEQVRVERNHDGQVVRTADSQLQDKGKRGYFIDSIGLQAGQVYLSRINLNREHGRVDVPHVRTLRAAVPVYVDSAEPAGIVIINMDFGSVLDAASRQAAADDVVMIVNEAGDFLTHNDPSLTFGFDLGIRHRLASSYPEIAERFYDQGQKSTQAADDLLIADNIVHYTRAYIDPTRSERYLGFIQLTPYTSLVAEAANLTRRNLPFLVALIVIGSLAALLFSRLLTRRLQQISTVAQRVAAGETNVTLPSGSQDEIGVLSAALQSMLDQIGQREARLQAREARLQTILQTVVNGVITIDEKGIIESINYAATGMFGYDRDELLGANVKILMSDEHASKHDGYLQNYLHSGEKHIIGKQREVSGRRKDGSVFPMYVAVNEAWLGDKHLFVGVVQDITERVEHERRLRKYAERLEASNRELQDFAYIASHDLQEPLRKIQAFSDRLMVKEYDNLSERGQDYLQRVSNAAARMQALIESLLSLSRIGTRGGEFVTVDLNKVARDAVSDLQARIKDSAASVDIEQLPVVQADPVQMRQLLQNLIGNALKFIDPARQPHIRVYPTDETAAADIDGAAVNIVVEDNGIGFDAKYAQRVFEPFERLHARQEYEGTGMGLSICRKIVERHGGVLTASSTPGEGSRFLISIPANNTQANVVSHSIIS
jgi:PAS domain S-box-containing protein